MSLGQKSRFLAAITATSVLALSTPVFAQNSQAAEDRVTGNSIIVVTAQKKSQNLQDVPISITAFDAEALQAERLEGVADIGRLTPGLYVTPNPADPTGVRINIRGIGTFDPQVGQDSRIAVYVDGVYLGKSQGLAFDSPDLERVEILKGPQGTLYGRNSVAGAVNLISAVPEPGEWSGKLTAEYGRFNHKKFSGVVNAPIGENGAIRLSGMIKDQDGWVKNDGPGTDFGGSTSYGFRAAMGVDLTPTFNVVAAFDYNKVKTEPLFYQSIPGFANPGSLFAASVATAAGRQNRVTTSFTNEKGDLDNLGASITANWEVADDHNLKFIASYRETESSRFVDLIPTANPAIINGILNSDIIPNPPAPGGIPGVQSINNLIAGSALAFQLAGRPIRADFANPFVGPGSAKNGLFLSPPGGSPALSDHEQYSFELTYNGEVMDGALEYTLGAFYFGEKTGTPIGFPGNRNDANSYLFILAGLSPALGSPIITSALTAGGLAPTLNNPNVPQATKNFLIQTQLLPSVNTLTAIYGGARQSAANELRISTDAFALYGEATWHVSDRLRLTGGLRFSDESKDGFGQAVSPFFLDNVDLLGNVIQPNISTFHYNTINPSAIIEFDIHPDIMYYASFKQSFRSGGFNQGAVGLRLPQQTFGPDFNFGREKINAYEFGMKADIFDNRVRINAAGFYYDFKDQQTTVSLNPIVATSRAVVNANEKIWGAEVDILVSVTDELSLSGSYSYINGNAGDVVNPITGVAQVRTELQGTPKNSFRVGASYDGQISDKVGIFANISYSYKDDVLAIPENQLRLSNQNLVSGRIGIDHEMDNGNKFTFSVWGENIFDDKYQIDSLPFETFAFRTQVFGQPATYGVTAGIEF
ncbi:TonB-dependent receptor [Parasphingorhabdus halotolerans]|uniref:TonB-dependent receptor n=1 Tax=Parasphingorhabdus halotolerans TaxID=2725558 RepID=A0A6H2DJD2_9SPHN|nr:TonB-dependent receptor [Parasphingorhabdus halotolerans]QJB68789.1 TonB-dependent receptor [Parasphingorhabdus halotolerans]